MRFRLVEEPTDNKITADWPPSTATLDAFAKQKSLKQQKHFLETYILPLPKFRNLFGIRPIIIQSMMIEGLDPKKNEFLRFVCEIPFAMANAKSFKAKMLYVYESFKNQKLNLKNTALHEVLLNESLWNRSDSDFRYSLNAFNLFSQPKKAAAYLKNTSKVDLGEFMKGEVVKPAGQDGSDGDTIYNVIERWADGNEYSPEEIEARKKAQEEEEENEKKGVKGSANTSVTVNVNGAGAGGDSKIEWTYEFFKDALEKVFANKSKFQTKLGSKNDYLERAFATFKLTEFTAQETPNKIYKKASSAIKDGDVSKFGDPHNIDEPIYLTVKDESNLMGGMYVFHKFVSLADNVLPYYKQVANKNLGNLKRHLNNVTPDNDKDANAHLQAIVDALGELSGIPQK